LMFAVYQTTSPKNRTFATWVRRDIESRTIVRVKYTTDVRVCQEVFRTFFRFFLFLPKAVAKNGQNSAKCLLTAVDWYSRIAAKLNAEQYPYGGSRERAVGASPPKSCGEGAASLRAGNGPPDSSVTGNEVPVSQMGIQVEPRIDLIRPEPKFAALGAFLCPEPNPGRPEVAPCNGCGGWRPRQPNERKGVST